MQGLRASKPIETHEFLRISEFIKHSRSLRVSACGFCRKPFVQSSQWPIALGGQPAWVDVARPCRACPECLAVRRWAWSRRCQSETLLTMQAGLRTWFGTFTASPVAHVYSFAAACVAHGGCLPNTDKEEFLWRHQQLRREVSNFWKRLRAKGAALRYVCVVEEHEEKLAGLPHYHMLIHEQDKPIRKSSLKAEWTLGHSDFKLVRDNVEVADYATKYIAKKTWARIMASEMYGLGGSFPWKVEHGESAS